MKKLLLLFGLVIVTSSCKENNDPVILSDGDNYEYSVEVIEGCEYIYRISGTYRGFMAHKGNCKNPIHKN